MVLRINHPLKHMITSTYYTRVFGKFFNGLEDWINVRSSGRRYRFWKIFRVFTTLLKNSWKVPVTFLSFEVIFSFSVSVILSLDLILLEKIKNVFPKTFFYLCEFYCINYRNFTYFSGVKILWKGIVSA